MASVGKENVPENVIIPGNSADLERKESMLLTGNALSSSKIPVLSRRRIRSDLKQSQQQQEECLTKKTGTSAGLVPGASGLEFKVGVQSRNNTRKGLREMQLNPSGHRNASVVPDGKELSTDFVPDFAALASILSNTGLTNHMVSASNKPSLAQRIPLKGNRACSVSTGVRQVSRCLVVPETNFAPMSHISRPTLKDSDHQPSCSLVLNTQQLKKLSASLENPLGTLKPGVKGAKPSQLTTNLEDFVARPKGPSGISKDHLPVQGGLAGRKETIGTPSKESEFVPDPAAKASILLNIGISHSALGTNGKLSLAQRVPVKEAQKTPGTCSNIKGENARLQGAPQSEKFGRVSCRSTQGLKGLEKSEASGVQLTTTPGRRCSTLDCSPYGLARRVPLACPQSSCRTPWTHNRMFPLSCTKKKVNGLGEITPQKGTTEPKQDATNKPWKSIAVCLFEDEMAASSKKALMPPVIPPEMGKLQRIEFLTQLLRDEVNGSTEPDITPSLVELQKLLLVHHSAVQDTSEAGLLTASPPDTKPDVPKEAPTSTVTPEIVLTTTSSQPHDCRNPTMPSAHPPLSNAVNTGKVKQRLDDLLSAPHHFHEACLNIECAFYTTRIHSFPQVSGQRCKEPVAKVLDAQEATHFIPISPPPAATEDLSQDAHDRIADTEIAC